MALEKTVKTPHGFDAENAYHRVEGVRLIDKANIGFQVRSYKDSTESQAFADTAFVCAYELDGANPIAQAYKHVKSLEDFAGAVDC